jgi:hypothetical protein
MSEVEGFNKTSGEAFDMRTILIDVTTRIAIVKAAVLYLGLRFSDYLTLAKLANKWCIVHKAYEHD